MHCDLRGPIELNIARYICERTIGELLVHSYAVNKPSTEQAFNVVATGVTQLPAELLEALNALAEKNSEGQGTFYNTHKALKNLTDKVETKPGGIDTVEPTPTLEKFILLGGEENITVGNPAKNKMSTIDEQTKDNDG